MPQTYAYAYDYNIKSQLHYYLKTSHSYSILMKFCIYLFSWVLDK